MDLQRGSAFAHFRQLRPYASIARNNLQQTYQVGFRLCAARRLLRMIPLRRREYKQLDGWLNSTKVRGRYRIGCHTYTKVCRRATTACAARDLRGDPGAEIDRPHRHSSDQICRSWSPSHNLNVSRSTSASSYSKRRRARSRVTEHWRSANSVLATPRALSKEPEQISAREDRFGLAQDPLL